MAAKSSTRRTIEIRIDGAVGSVTRAAAQATAAVRRAASRINRTAATARMRIRLDDDSTGFKKRLKNMQDGVADAFSSGVRLGLNSPYVVLAIAAISPLLAAAAAAGLAGGFALVFGGGLLAAGIVAAFQDPKIKKAAEKSAGRLKKAFSGIGNSLKDTILFGLNQLTGRLEKTVIPRIKVAISLLEPQLKGSIMAIDESLKRIDFKALAIAAQPFIDAFNKHLPDIIEAITEFFHRLMENEDVLKTWEQILNNLPGVILAISDALIYMTESFQINVLMGQRAVDGIVAAWEWAKRVVTAAINGIISWLKSLGESLGRARDQASTVMAAIRAYFASLGASLERAKGQFNTAVAAIRSFFAGLGASLGRAKDQAQAAMNGIRGAVLSVVAAVTTALFKIPQVAQSIWDRLKRIFRQALPVPKIPNIGSLLGRATGGMAYPGQPYAVGSEVFVPSTTGRIFSRSQAEQELRGAGGGDGETTIKVEFVGLPVELQKMINVTVEKSNRRIARDLRTGSGRV